MGLGYYLFKKDRFSLKTLLGPAAIFHTGGESCSDIQYCGELIPGWDVENLLKWKINERFDINISDVYSLASMHNLTGSNYLRTTLNFRPYLDKNLTMSLFFENSHYEFTSSEPRNNVRFQIGRDFSLITRTFKRNIIPRNVIIRNKKNEKAYNCRNTCSINYTNIIFCMRSEGCQPE